METFRDLAWASCPTLAQASTGTSSQLHRHFTKTYVQVSKCCSSAVEILSLTTALLAHDASDIVRTIRITYVEIHTVIF